MWGGAVFLELAWNQRNLWGAPGVLWSFEAHQGAFSLFAEFLKAVGFHVSHFGMPLCIVNDIRNFVYYSLLWLLYRILRLDMKCNRFEL